MKNNDSKFILSLDQGTTSSRAVLYNLNFEMVAMVQKEFEQLYPNPGWVEHDPDEIWSSQLEVAKEVLKSQNILATDVVSIGITNQRETTIVWNKNTGKPVYNAIVWQDRRTSSTCEELLQNGHEKNIKSKTGLLLDAYFSATKIEWILNNVTGVRALAEKGDLLFGTVDSWLVWKLTKGQKHITDVSNASRTLLFNIHTLKWDTELLQLFNIPISMLPDVVDSSGLLATSHASVFNYPIAITSLIGDQQSALFGQLCTKVGMVKCTYGTGCFMMINTGNTVVESSHKMLSTIAWRINGKTTYALEGSVFVGGAVIQWLRDKLEFFTEASDSMLLAEAASDNGGVYFVPALTGLGAPYWDPDARGTIFGITRGTTKAHLTRAALESIAFQVNDVLKAMSLDINSPISQLRVDGGAAANELLLQFQSDVSRVDVLKPTQLETTALGAAFLAALGAGVSDLDSLNKNWILEHDLKPTMSQDYVNSLISRWDEAITRTLGWGGTDVK